MAMFLSLCNHNFYYPTNATSIRRNQNNNTTMKVIFASLSAVLLGSVPGVLSVEVSFFRAGMDAALGGADC